MRVRLTRDCLKAQARRSKAEIGEILVRPWRARQRTSVAWSKGRRAPGDAVNVDGDMGRQPASGAWVHGRVAPSSFFIAKAIYHFTSGRKCVYCFA